MRIEDVKDLKPIVEETVKTLYGENTQNVKIREADQYPIFGPLEWWKVEAEFEDDKFKYLIEMKIQMEDGKVTKHEEKERMPKVGSE